MGSKPEHGPALTSAAQPLTAFAGTELYLDAMILVGFLLARSPWHAPSRALFERAIKAARPIRLVTAALTIDEVVFALLQDLILDPPYAVTRSRSQYLSEHPQVVRDLMGIINAPLRRVLELVSVEPVLGADVAAMSDAMAISGMLPRDAIHVGVMRRLGVTAIASDDDAFGRCAGISLFKP